MNHWNDPATAPKDRAILAFCNYGETPFIAVWDHVGRYTSSPKMWIGHEFGAVDQIEGWQELPSTVRP